MPFTTKPPFKEILRRYQAFKDRIWRVIGQQAVNFFKDNFTRQGFLDGGKVNRWRARSEQLFGKQKKRKRRNILIGTGTLRKSIRIVNWGKNFVTVGATPKNKEGDKNYARIHNEGGTIIQTPTEKQRAFFWRMFYMTKDEAWRGMAMSKTIRIRIPRRKFIGNSTDLNREIERVIRLGILKIFKK